MFAGTVILLWGNFLEIQKKSSCNEPNEQRYPQKKRPHIAVTKNTTAIIINCAAKDSKENSPCVNAVTTFPKALSTVINSSGNTKKQQVELHGE